jgi:hypothetical protein
MLANLSPSVKFEKKENLMINLPFFLFMISEKLMILFHFIIFLQNLIISVFIENAFCSLLIYTSKAYANSNGKFSKEFPIHCCVR